ncbi:hypothetical protein EV361DRAFT_813444, partial [Lentinula raphanica]
MLYHELKKIGVPTEITDWMKRRYRRRVTQLSFDDFLSEPFEVPGGEDQGDPFSAVGYILYAAGLLKCLQETRNEEGFAFMDDLAGLKWGIDIEEVHTGIEQMMDRRGGILEWARSHNCQFGIPKFKLVD